MKLRNEFTVDVPLERAWSTLLDIERVASFLPGATIEPGESEGVYRGSMRVKLGPMLVQYQGTARLAAVDEGARTADIAVEAKEARGQGTASAVIRNTLVPVDGRTRVIAETDLHVTGRQAQFGRGIMQDVAGRMLDEFARSFERHLLEGEAGPPAEGAPAAATPAPEGPPPPPEPPRPPAAERAEALDLGAVLGRTTAARAAAAVGALLAVAALVAAGRRRRRRGIAVDVRYSW